MFAFVIGIVALALSPVPPAQAEITEVGAALKAPAIEYLEQYADGDGQSRQRTVRAHVQPRPGAPPEEIDMRVHESPVDPPSVAAAAADLADDELVLGLVVDGQPIAYPIRYLALYEVLNDVVPGERRSPGGGHDTSALGLGLAIGNEAWFFPFPELARADTPVRMSGGGTAITIHFDAEGLTAWAENDAGELLMSVLAYEQGWRSFYPHTSTWR